MAEKGIALRLSKWIFTINSNDFFFAVCVLFGEKFIGSTLEWIGFIFVDFESRLSIRKFIFCRVFNINKIKSNKIWLTKNVPEGFSFILIDILCMFHQFIFIGF